MYINIYIYICIYIHIYIYIFTRLKLCEGIVIKKVL